MGLIYRGDGVFIDDDPLDLEKMLPKDWSPALKDVSVYWTVEHLTNFRTYTRLAIIKGSPKKGKTLDSKTIHTNEWEESVAPLTELSEAVDMYQKDEKFVFEEFPFVEVETEEDYNLVIAGQGRGPKEWSPKKKDSEWKGPGVYDFRDRPPTRAYESVEAYELQGAEERARQALDAMYDDDYKAPLRKLLADYIGGGE